ncbi:MAG: transporter ATP-binding protein [Pseudomonadota bacterium]|jgi:branched-chain amino acid transport system ATP-binding protein
MLNMLLTVDNLQAKYGASQVLFEVSFSLAEGQVMTLLGRNGMGKTTTVKCLSGRHQASGGRMVLAGKDITAVPSYLIARQGLGLVPEGRYVFPTLSVYENLVATADKKNGGQWTLARVEQLFPRLAERRSQMAGKLSGGEQQMLVIGRALMTNPKLLVLDEATEGLAPLIRAEIWACLKTLKHEGMSMLVIDKNLAALAPLADHHVVLEKGHVVWRGDSVKLAAELAKVESFLSV